MPLPPLSIGAVSGHPGAAAAAPPGTTRGAEDRGALPRT